MSCRVGGGVGSAGGLGHASSGGGGGGGGHRSGLNTETDPRLLHEGQHPTFQNITYSDGYLRPTKPDLSVSAPSYPLTAMKNDHVTDFFYHEGAEGWSVNVAHSGAVPDIRDPGGTEEDIAMAAPGSASPTPTLAANATGLADGESRTYRGAWLSTNLSADYHTSPGPTVSITNSSGGVRKATVAQPAGTPPSMAESWILYVLEDTTGIWRKVGETTLSSSIEDTSDVGDLGDLDRYDGPLDSNGDPETLVVPSSSTIRVASHKECVFCASGKTLEYSDATEQRWFRDWASLDADATIKDIISWNDTLYVLTSEGIRAVIGNPPYFEIRTVHNHSGCISPYSAALTPVGIFYLGNDAIHLFDGTRVTNISRGHVTDWIESIGTPATAVGGATNSAYYLWNDTITSDSDYEALRFDWQLAEWGTHRSPTLPQKEARWDESNHRLVYNILTSYYAVAEGTAAVKWDLRYRTVGDGQLRRMPPWLFCDMTGTATYTLTVDDTDDDTHIIQGVEKVRLPRSRGREWYWRMNGSDSSAGTVIRDLKIGRTP